MARMPMQELVLSVRDYLQYASAPRHLLSFLLELQGYLLVRGNRANDIARSLQKLTNSARLAVDARSLTGLENKINNRMAYWSLNDFDWDRFFPNSAPRVIRKSIILKKPRPKGEKGVLFVAWEDNWLRLLRYGDLQKLARDYNLVLSPTWSPPHDLPMLTACKAWPSDFFTILSNFEDVPIFPRISSKIIVIPLLASNWVNPSIFKPSEDHSGKKVYDIAVLSSFAAYKRHMGLFKILKKLRKDTRAVLLGRSWEGRTAETIKREAESFQVADRITIMENLGDKEMIEVLQSAKVSVITSLREGSCVAVAESLFCDVPVALLEEARIGSKSMINGATGRLLRPGRVSQDLEDFIQHYQDYAPRKWMLENGMCCESSSRRLNEEIKRRSIQNGEPWTTDLLAMHWRPTPQYMCQPGDSEISQEYSRFSESYNVGIEYCR
jgi:glycosyltransferase involved in cell wall biosynthesis